MEKRELVEGDVVQLHPDHKFGGFLVVVTDPKPFGCQGYLMAPCEFDACRFKGKAYIRPTWDIMEYVGRLEWIWKDDEDDAIESEC